MGDLSTDPVIAFESQAAWEAWLERHHATSTGVWIKIAKKATGIPTVTHAEALCYGWIDGQRNKFDDQWFLQRFTPRRARSNWSKVNCGKVAELMEQGRMRPAGLREVERAKSDGRWDAAYDAPSQPRRRMAAARQATRSRPSGGAGRTSPKAPMPIEAGAFPDGLPGRTTG